MALEKLGFEIYEEYRDMIDRYMELVKCEQKEKVDAATVHIMYAIQDINTQIEKYNLKKPDISIYYQMMVKTDYLISIIELLYKIFEPAQKRDIIWAKDYKSIQKFRLYRSLTLAHPLETTRYEDLGFGKKNDKWCQDIHVLGNLESSFQSELSNSDFVMEIIEKGNSLPTKQPINVKDDILLVAAATLNHLSDFTKGIVSKLSDITENLKKTPLAAKSTMNLNDYIETLLKDLEKRYPNEIEKIEHENNITEMHCVLLQALERLNYVFADPVREEKYRAYKAEIQQRVYAYGDSVQNMDLEETKVNKKLSDILYPDSSILSDKSLIDKAHYRYDKIVMYLSDSTEQSVESAHKKLEEFSYDGCCGMGVCTNAEWGVIQLLTLQDELTPYFPIDFNATNKELFFQFCTALFYANKSLN